MEKKGICRVICVGIAFLAMVPIVFAGQTSSIDVKCQVNAFTDLDDDGMDDQWEVHMGFDPTLPDGYEDADGDGLLNYQEYWVGTDPYSVDSDNDNAWDADELYSVKHIDGGLFHNIAVRDGHWVRVKDFSPQGTYDAVFTNVLEVAGNFGVSMLLTADGEVWEWEYDTGAPTTSEPITKIPTHVDGCEQCGCHCGRSKSSSSGKK